MNTTTHNVTTAYRVVCSDGEVRHDELFTCEADAIQFADYGHACLNVDSHEFEPVPVAEYEASHTFTREVRRDAPDVESYICQVCGFWKVGASLVDRPCTLVTVEQAQLLKAELLRIRPKAQDDLVWNLLSKIHDLRRTEQTIVDKARHLQRDLDVTIGRIRKGQGLNDLGEVQSSGPTIDRYVAHRQATIDVVHMLISMLDDDEMEDIARTLAFSPTEVK